MDPTFRVIDWSSSELPLNAEAITSSVPSAPGVYVIRGRTGTAFGYGVRGVLVVGTTTDLRSDLAQHTDDRETHSAVRAIAYRTCRFAVVTDSNLRRGGAAWLVERFEPISAIIESGTVRPIQVNTPPSAND